MSFTASVRTCFGKFFTLSGRASRSEYWWFFLFVLLGGAIASLIDGMIFGFAAEARPGHHPVSMIFAFVTCFPALAASWRRMHDTDRPGWYTLLPTLIVLAAFAGMIIGVLGFGLIEATGVDPANLHGIAALLGFSGLMTAYFIVFVAAVLKLWWLTRPGTPAANTYGPPPATLA